MENTPRKEQPSETKPEENLKVEEQQLNTARSEETTNQSLNFTKIKSIQLEKKSYANIASIMIPQSRVLEKQQAADSKTSSQTIQQDPGEIPIQRNVRLGANEQKRGLFNYAKK